MKLTSRLLLHTVLFGLTLTFVGKTIQSIIEYKAGKVSRSTQDIFDHYITFPTISVCLGSDSTRTIVGFNDTETRSINDSLDEFRFVRHFKNGYAHFLCQYQV